MAMDPASPGTVSSYASALRRLLSLADFERMTGARDPLPKYDLGRIRELVRRLGDPHECAPAVHIAGTKGKGSVAIMVSGILTAAGYHTGLFTSPHLHTFRERIRVDGVPVSEELFARHLDRVWPEVEAMGPAGSPGRPTTFEALAAMAFDLFRAQGVDAQVVEVGLGGRLDTTNVVHGAVAVITSLSLDHTAILGNDLARIAWEKAGVIKPGVRVVLAPQPPEAEAVVAEVCRERQADLCRLGHDVTWHLGAHDLSGQAVRVHTLARSYDLWIPLLGAHQAENAAVAVAAVEALGLKIDEAAVARGLRRIEWPGRFQVVSKKPCVVLDGAHNPHSVARLMQAVRDHLPPGRTVLVFGCSADKDLAGMVAELAPTVQEAVVCASRHPRAVPSSRLSEAFRAAGVPARAAPDVSSALADAVAQAGAGDVILVTGSLFIVAEALEGWYGIPSERYPELEPDLTGTTS